MHYLAEGRFVDINEEARRIIYLRIETGVRLSEACTLDRTTIHLDPAELSAIALHNKAIVYDLLFKAASEAMLMIAADAKHLGARIGITAVLHAWGSAITHQSARAHDRAGRRHLARRHAQDLDEAELPPAGAGEARCRTAMHDDRVRPRLHGGAKSSAAG